ncbi:hypothetical protein [Thiomonas sp.]
MFAIKALFTDEVSARTVFAEFQETLSESREGPAEFYAVLQKNASARFTAETCHFLRKKCGGL